MRGLPCKAVPPLPAQPLAGWLRFKQQLHAGLPWLCDRVRQLGQCVTQLVDVPIALLRLPNHTAGSAAQVLVRGGHWVCLDGFVGPLDARVAKAKTLALSWPTYPGLAYTTVRAGGCGN